MSAKTDNTRKTLLNATIDLVAEVGLESFTTKALAAKAQLAEGSLYNYFENKDELLAAAFIKVDKEIAAMFDGYNDIVEQLLADKVNTTEVMWRKYYHYMIEHPNNTLFYSSFKASPRYNEDIMAQQAVYFSDFSSVIMGADREVGLFSAVQGPVLWTFTLNTATTFVGMIIKGELPNTKETEDQIWSLISRGVDGLIEDLEKKKCENK